MASRRVRNSEFFDEIRTFYMVKFVEDGYYAVKRLDDLQTEDFEFIQNCSSVRVNQTVMADYKGTLYKAVVEQIAENGAFLRTKSALLNKSLKKVTTVRTKKPVANDSENTAAKRQKICQQTVKEKLLEALELELTELGSSTSPSKECSGPAMSPLMLSPSPPHSPISRTSPFPTVLQEIQVRDPCSRCPRLDHQLTECRGEKLQLEEVLLQKNSLIFELQQKITALEAQLKRAETSPSASSTTHLTRPRAGVVEPALAGKFKMIDIGSGLFIHIDQHAKVLAKAKDGRSMVREMMNVFFSREQLCSGSVNNLDGVILKAIIGFVMCNQKVTTTASQLRQCILRKLSGYKHKERTKAITAV